MTAFAELGARSHFSLLDGASSPQELVTAAKAFGHAGIGICDTNSLAGVVRGHVAAKAAGLPYLVGVRLNIADAGEYLVWPTCRTSYGRLTRVLSESKMAAPKGEAVIALEAMHAAAEGWVVAAIPGADLGPAFAARVAGDRAAMRNRLALPLHVTARAVRDGRDQERMDRLAQLAPLLATTDVRYHHPARRRLADVLTAIRQIRPVDAIGHDAERGAGRRPGARIAGVFDAVHRARRGSVVEQHGARDGAEHLRGHVRPGGGDAVGGGDEAAGALTEEEPTQRRSDAVTQGRPSGDAMRSARF
ncbi:PHP domain-containing protein [Roseomonas sp. F4]